VFKIQDINEFKFIEELYCYFFGQFEGRLLL